MKQFPSKSNNVLINKGKDREKQAKDCGRNEVSDNGEGVRGKQREEAMAKGELGKKHTEKGEGQTIKEREINKAGSKKGKWNKELQKRNVTMIKSPLDDSRQSLQSSSEDSEHLGQSELCTAPVLPQGTVSELPRRATPTWSSSTLLFELG